MKKRNVISLSHRPHGHRSWGTLLTLVLGLALGVSLFATEASADVDFRRGDSNSDGVIDISDSIATLQWLFICGDDCDLVCRDAADFNDDGAIDISDAIATLDFLFKGGAMPAAPYEEAGRDATDDELTCDGP